MAILTTTNQGLNFVGGTTFIQTGTTTVMSIETGGNIGIGITNPADRLDLYDADDNVGMYFHTATSGTGGGNGLRVGQNNANAFVWNYEATPLSLATGGTARLTISATGGIRFNTGYGAGTLVTDASGNITVSSGGGAGGPYLPLAGGTLTGALAGTGASFTGLVTTKIYKVTSASISNTYVRICEIDEINNQLSSVIRVTMTAHGGSHVTTCNAIIAVGHSQDILIQSSNLAYTQVTLKVESNNNGMFTLSVKSSSSNAASYKFDIEGLSNNLTITLLPTSSQTGTTLEHTTNFGTNITSTGGVMYNKFGGKLFLSSVDANTTSATALVLDGDEVEKRTLGTGAFGPTPVGAYLPLSAGSSYPLTGVLYLGNVGSDQKIQFQRTGGNVYSIEHDSAQLYFYNRTSTESPLVIQNDGDILMNAGNVGIGTTSPDDKLDVVDGNAQMVFGTASSDRTYMQFKHNAVPVDGEELCLMDFSGYNSASQNTRYVILTAKAEDVTDGSEDGSLTFQTMKDGTATQAMTLRSGNVGIGTTDPQTKLEVNGGLVKVVDGSDTAFYSGDYVRVFGTQSYGFRNSAGSAIAQISLTGNSYFNGGNVGIGTTGPGRKLDVAGITRTQGFSNTNNYIEKLLYANFVNGVANQNYDIQLGNISFWGYIEVEITGTYSYQNTPGKLTKVYAIGTNPNGTIYANNPRVVDALGPIKNNIALGDFSWDSTNSVYRIRISHIVSTGNDYTIKVKVFTHASNGSTGASGILSNLNISSIYTQTALTRQYVYYNDNVGIGTTSPYAITQINGATPTGTIGYGDSANSGQLYITSNAAVGSQLGGRIAFGGIAGNGGGAFNGTRQDSVYGTIEGYKFNATPNNSGGGLSFKTNFNNTGALIERMNIDQAGNVVIGGNVGINTTSPNTRLHINGSTRVTGDLYFDATSTVLYKIKKSGTSLQIWGNAIVPAIEVLDGSFLKLGSYALSGLGTPTHLLGVTSTGQVVKTTSGGDLPGGPYLPLSAGGTKPLVGDLYINSSLYFGGANERIYMNGGGATNWRGVEVNSSGLWSWGETGIGNYFSKKVGIGTTSPSAKLSVIGDINFGGGNNDGIIEVSGSGDLIFKYKGSDPALTLDGGAVKTIVHNRLDALDIVAINNPSNNESILNIRDDDSSSNGHIAFENSSEITGIVSSGTDFINFRTGDGVAMTDSPVLTMLPNRVGINTTSPNSNVSLDVDGRVLIKDSNGVADLYLGNYATNKHFRFHTNNSATFFDMNCGTINWREGSSVRYYFYPSTANMTINGTLTQNSDERVKENIVEIGDCISKVQAMKGVYYNRTDFNTDITKVGVIAQDVEAVLPELILEAPDTGLKSVAYAELTAVLINAIKEQQEIIEDLKTRVQQLEN